MPDPVNPLIERPLPDGGPRYVETPTDLEHFPDFVAEPWNTGSATLFVIIAVIWAVYLRGRYREHAFLTMCLPLLTAGGMGGVLYHGLRKYRAFFLLDVIPIYVLGVGVAIWLWVRLGPKIRYVIGMIGFLFLLQLLAQLQLPRQWAINVSYASLAAMVLLPLVLALLRTRFQSVGWVATALVCFAIAWTCRIADTIRPPLLPMGTHWLWHLFGALTTAALSVYVFRIERVSLAPAAAGAVHAPGGPAQRE